MTCLPYGQTARSYIRSVHRWDQAESQAAAPVDNPADLTLQHFPRRIKRLRHPKHLVLPSMLLAVRTWRARRHPLTSPPRPAPSIRSHGGGHLDAFVVRLNADGSALDFATFLGGGAGRRLWLAVDAGG